MDNNKLLNYKYIYNTLEKPSTISTDNTLKVGSKVKNLLIELSDETVWNKNFTEYYGSEKPAQCWEPSEGDDTIKWGRLNSSAIVKENTLYMLQIINPTSPTNDINKKNIITIKSNETDTGRNIEFDNCIFFKTKPGEKYITLSIYGLSYGYQIYSQNSDRIYEMRSFRTDTKAKIFLFETNLPWAVDNNGIITHLENIKLNIPSTAASVGLDANLGKDQIKNLFKTAPDLIVSGNKILIPLPDRSDSSTWELGNLWKYIGSKTPYPAIMDNIYLLVYRNFLTEEVRDYNDVKTTKQYGLLRTIQRTAIDDRDTYNTNGQYGFQIKQINISNIAPAEKLWKFTPIEITSSNTIIKISKDPKDYPNADLNILSLLGFNYSYSVKNGKENMYKYTSVSFAWGVKNGNEFERISDYSIPLIIDRSICTIEEKVYGSYSITTAGYTLTKNPADETYYTKPAIFMRKSS